jgi:hypothetical protein
MTDEQKALCRTAVFTLGVITVVMLLWYWLDQLLMGNVPNTP